MSQTIHFLDRAQEPRTVTIEGRGTNFGARLSDEETYRLLMDVSKDLPFTIMAKGYGDDSDWVGLDPTEDAQGCDDLADFVANGWGPFEVLIEAYNKDNITPEAWAALTEWKRPEPKPRLKSGHDILVEHLGEETAKAIEADMTANDLAFAYTTCGDCGEDDEVHGWHDDLTHRFA